MASIGERTVQIHFDRDEQARMPRDTFVVLTGDTRSPPTSESRRVGDVYLAKLDLATHTFESAWYYAADGWKRADLGDLRSHAIAHPELASRVLSISPDGTAVNWSKRDTIVRRERRARTLSRSQPAPHPRPTTPPRGTRSAPVTPHRGGSERYDPSAPLDHTLFSLSPTFSTFNFMPVPQTPRTPSSARMISFATPTSSRSSRTAPSPLFSTPSRHYSSPDTSFEISPTGAIFAPCGNGESPAKYTVPQKRPSIGDAGAPVPLQPAFVPPPTPTRGRRASITTTLAPVEEDPSDSEAQTRIEKLILRSSPKPSRTLFLEGADPVAHPPRSAMRPDAPTFRPTSLLPADFQPPRQSAAIIPRPPPAANVSPPAPDSAQLLAQLEATAARVQTLEAQVAQLLRALRAENTRPVDTTALAGAETAWKGMKAQIREVEQYREVLDVFFDGAKPPELHEQLQTAH